MLLMFMMAHHAAISHFFQNRPAQCPTSSTGFRKRTDRVRFQRKQRTKAQEQRAKAAEATAREQAEHDYVAASTHQQPAAKLTTIRAEVGRLKKNIDKLKNQADYL
jgi:hypothetical protein